MPCRESPFTKTNNSGGGFGEQQLLTDCKSIACTLAHKSPNVIQLSCVAVGDMDLLFMRTTRYESEASSGACSVLLLWPLLLGRALCFPAYLPKCFVQNHTESSAMLSCWQSYEPTHTGKWMPAAGSSCWNGLQMADGTCMPLPLWAIRSGPRRKIYYDPKEVQSALAQPLRLSQHHITPEPASQSDCISGCLPRRLL